MSISKTQVIKTAHMTDLIVPVLVVSFLILLLLAFYRYFSKRILKEMQKRRKQSLISGFIIAFTTPFQVAFVFLFVFNWFQMLLSEWYPIFPLKTLESLRNIVLTLALFWFVLRYITQIESRILSRNPRLSEDKQWDSTTLNASCQLLRIVVMINGVLIILPMLKVETSGLLAFGSVGALGVTFAAKDLLANFFGGLMIFLDRPFRVGDWVKSPEKDIEGTVHYIGWRVTHIQTFDRLKRYVPNSLFLNITIDNPSRMTHRRIQNVIGIRYDDASKVGLICQDIETLLRSRPEIDQTQTLSVTLTQFGDSALELLMKSFTTETTWAGWNRVRHEILVEVLAIVERHGAECAFPTTTLHVPEQVKIEQQSD